MTEEEAGPFDRLVDELKLQAWLAAAELRHPSLHQNADARKEISALAQMWDEIRLQAQLGKLEARDELEALDKQWRRFKHAASRTVEEVGDNLLDVLKGIREQSQELLDDAKD